MSIKRIDSLAHPHEPEPEAWPELWWMSGLDKAATEEAFARRYGGEGFRPRPSTEHER
jgi:hypothetical protein